MRTRGEGWGGSCGAAVAAARPRQPTHLGELEELCGVGPLARVDADEHADDLDQVSAVGPGHGRVAARAHGPLQLREGVPVAAAAERIEAEVRGGVRVDVCARPGEGLQRGRGGPPVKYDEGNKRWGPKLQGGAVPKKGRAEGGELVQGAAEGPHVGPRVVGPVRPDLGRHVVRRANLPAHEGLIKQGGRGRKGLRRPGFPLGSFPGPNTSSGTGA